MSMMVQSGRFGGGAPSGPTVVYQGTNAVGDAGGTHTYTNAPIGTAAADRLVIVAIAARRNAAGVRTVTGVTIGGNAATINVQTNVTGVSSGITVAIASLVVAAGTDATVVVTYSAGLSQSFISVYTVTGLNSTTATNSASATGNEAASSTLDITGPGIVVASFAGADGTLGDMTMVGVNEDYDQTSPASGTATFMRGGAGSVSGLSTQTNRTISVSSTANIEALAATSWT
ncbi:MAG: hypothetical protein E5Y73_11220 [Mesorhizobium sp.]|uniref:hypothetical protein n=1 Tax=Mesorhizobium sp. TaxID=1871066 RepID=UPI0011FD3470|nr:hypothetical protein [Mesorhizobium sp.]TIL94670.1 MAG: hypothetical protein E5Y73_11220 [Mesorhizobium sp.]